MCVYIWWTYVFTPVNIQFKSWQSWPISQVVNLCKHSNCEPRCIRIRRGGNQWSLSWPLCPATLQSALWNRDVSVFQRSTTSRTTRAGLTLFRQHQYTTHGKERCIQSHFAHLRSTQAAHIKEKSIFFKRKALMFSEVNLSAQWQRDGAEYYIT